MKFLSLSQPWLWSITDLEQAEIDARKLDLEPKRIENRSWPPPAADVGTRIALHAAKSWDDDAIRRSMKAHGKTLTRRKLTSKEGT